MIQIITYKETIEKIDEYLSGKLKREEIIKWANEGLSHRDNHQDVDSALIKLTFLEEDRQWRPKKIDLIDIRNELSFIMKEGSSYVLLMKLCKKIKENPWQVWKRERDDSTAYLHKDEKGELRVYVENSNGEFRFFHLLDEKEKSDDGQSYMINEGWKLVSQDDSKKGVENLLGDSFYYDEEEKKWKWRPDDTDDPSESK